MPIAHTPRSIPSVATISTKCLIRAPLCCMIGRSRHSTCLLTICGCSSVVEHLLAKERVESSNLFIRFYYFAFCSLLELSLFNFSQFICSALLSFFFFIILSFYSFYPETYCLLFVFFLLFTLLLSSNLIVISNSNSLCMHDAFSAPLA